MTAKSDIYSLGIVLYEMLAGEVPFKADSSVMVAMKHVREGLPDVQRRRPEISAALAAIVERATSKEVDNRYESVDDMVRDLEDALTYEAARAGDTEGEATAVLRQLPGDARTQASRRHGLARAGLYALAATVLAIAVALLITRLGGDGDHVPSGMGDLSKIQLGSRDARDYDPIPGDEQENGATAGLVLDGNPQTVWQTERYDNAELGNIKDGVGLILDAGRAVVARAIRVSTPVEGWKLELYVANSVPSSVADWTRVGGGTMSSRKETFNLDTGTQRFRYFLVWVTKLAQDPSGRWSTGISELRLLG
ncbi:hypothetical protein LCGC14_3087510 [marine sediment metagenome]|uniref:Protein kinase domain-containing protein n=1 Tax=marine sediment metagenome TaxID=412755 RepID=A0A0F8WC36_9ZZZZ